MSNIEELVDYINEQDEDGMLFDRVFAFLAIGLFCCGNSFEEFKNTVGQITPCGN